MAKTNPSNERTKRAFFQYLKYAGRYDQATVDRFETAILRWEDFSKNDDFSSFDEKKAIEFREWLARGGNRGKPLSTSTLRGYLRALMKFFGWLAAQKGFKNKINLKDVDYLQTSRKEEALATQTKPRNYPTFQYVKKLFDSIQAQNEVGRRDKAMVAFALLSGMRDRAIVTLPLGCFDRETLIVTQDPKRGVHTKRAKLIPTTLFPFDQEMLKCVLDWARYLEEKGFGNQDPLFPRAKNEFGTDFISFTRPCEVEHFYWAGTGRIREVFKKHSIAAGLKYFPPHTFRHLAVDLAFRAFKPMEELKAISQNFGHENTATSISEYATLTPERLTQVIKRIDFEVRKDS